MLASGSEVETVDDAAITSLVKASLLSHLLLNSRTQTSGGVVTLSGHADNIAEKDLGSDLAIEIAGVKRVINNMVIPTALAGNEL
jgi:osmotically-inducible protein OsmY